MLYNLPTIELKETVKGSKFLYEAIENGQVVATRTSTRKYVACLISDSKIIANGVGRLDLIPGALKGSNQHIRVIAIPKQ